MRKSVWLHWNLTAISAGEVISCMGFTGHFSLLFSPWVEPAHRVAVITWRRTPRWKGDILSMVVVPPSSESPPPSFRDSRHPISSFFSVDLMQESDSCLKNPRDRGKVTHVKKWRGLINWLFLLFLLFIKIIYIISFIAKTIYVPWVETLLTKNRQKRRRQKH